VPRLPKLPVPSVPAPLKAPPPRPGEGNGDSDGNGKVGPAHHAKEAGITVVDWVDERTSLSGGARWLMFLYLVAKLGTTAPPWIKAEGDPELRKAQT
jgi:menaquinol-cytochrome c reductase cytochrome b subunit